MKHLGKISQHILKTEVIYIHMQFNQNNSDQAPESIHPTRIYLWYTIRLEGGFVWCNNYHISVSSTLFIFVHICLACYNAIKGVITILKYFQIQMKVWANVAKYFQQFNELGQLHILPAILHNCNHMHNVVLNVLSQSNSFKSS